jgi:hypothetical protein
METKEIVKVGKLNAQEYIKPIGFTVVLVILAFLLKSMEYGRMESLFTILSILLIIVLIPVNQIFRIKRIHIYNIVANENLTILYQDLLRDKKLEVPIEDIKVKVGDTSIRGCSKLELRLPDQTINQYCNQIWSNQQLKEVKNQIDDLKKHKQF